MTDESAGDVVAINRENQAVWDSKAAFWDERMGEGNDFQKQLIWPATERLLELKSGETVLDAACGNGVSSRQLARRGARVVAFDFSETFVERARARSADLANAIDYRVIDATDLDQLMTLGERRFDAAICNMALMDMAAIDPLLSALTRLLKPEGRFVFSVMHPCFNSNGVALAAESFDDRGQIRTTYAVKVSRYLGLGTETGVGMPGEPLPHYYFFRPLHVLLNPCFRAGFVMDAMEEPAFDGTASSPRFLTWTSFTEIPPVIACRLRPNAKSRFQVQR